MAPWSPLTEVHRVRNSIILEVSPDCRQPWNQPTLSRFGFPQRDADLSDTILVDLTSETRRLGCNLKISRLNGQLVLCRQSIIQCGRQGGFLPENVHNGNFDFLDSGIPGGPFELFVQQANALAGFV